MILDPMWDCGLLTRGLLNFNCSYKRDRQNNRERLWFIFLQEIKLNSTQVMDKSKQPRRKRARLHFSEKKQSETRRDRTACVASLFKYVFCFPTEPNLIRPCARSLTTASAKHKPEERRCPTHTNTYANSITSSSELPCAHMLLQASILTHTLTWVLKRNKSCRAGWSSPCFLSKSFIFAPQQESRHHNSHPRYSIAVPTMEGKKERLSAFVCCGYI